MRFYGEPGQLIKIRKRKPFSRDFVDKPLGRFDDEGEFITDDPAIIERMKRRGFEFEWYTCKKCDYETENKGSFLAHHREVHKKEVI